MGGLRILISGERVQEVGYRIHLLWLAKSLGIPNMQAANTPEGVEVLVEGPRDKLEEFVEQVKATKPPHAKVEAVKIQEYTGNVMTTADYYQILSLEHLSKIVNAGVSMLGKQDQTLEEIRSLRKDLKTILDERLRRIEEEIARIKIKIGLV